MRQSRVVLCFLSVILALLVGACEETSRTGDGGEGDWGTETCPGGVDKSIDFKTAIDLAEKTEVEGHVCPTGDRDFYKITVPTGKKLLRVKLNHSVTKSPVALTYQLFNSAEQPVGLAPEWTGSGIRTFDDFHCLTEAGTFYIVVGDEGNDGKDGNNPYTLSFEAVADSDTTEPNDTKDKAQPVGKDGYISCTGDKDYYKVTVTADGKLLEVKLSNTGPNEVDLKYSIYDDKDNLIGTDGVPDGMKEAAALSTIHGVPGKGTYYIVVEDDKGDDSDPTAPYTLAVTELDEPDQNDKPKRNDSPTSPTVLGTFGCGGGLQTFTKTGYIASKADVDYYRLDIGTCSPMAVMEVTVSYGGNSVVDPQVTYIYPDPDTSCTKDTCCRVLSKSCIDFIDCLNITGECVPKGDAYCADTDCEPQASLSCPQEKRCKGAVVCLGGQCGVEQMDRSDDDGEKDGAQVRTAQPLIHGGPYYILVTDLKNDDYEYGKPYTLTVKVRTDPDGAKELNSQYFSQKVLSHLGINTNNYHANVARAKQAKVTLGSPMTGYLSYEGDQDWYVLDWPCTGGECTLSASFSYTGNCAGVKGSKDTDGDKIVDDGLEFAFALRWSKPKDKEDDGDMKDSFPKNPTTGSGGSFGGGSNCWLLRNTGTYLFSVTDMGHNVWSWDCGYTITISKHVDGCPQPPCAVYNGTCYVP
jgi:hypothetical protein